MLSNISWPSVPSSSILMLPPSVEFFASVKSSSHSFAVTGDARRRDEIELVVIDRVPCAVFRPLEAGHVSSLAVALDLGAGEIVDIGGRVGRVADRHQVEMRAVHRLVVRSVSNSIPATLTPYM